MEEDHSSQQKEPMGNLPVPFTNPSLIPEDQERISPVVSSLFSPETPLWIFFFPHGDQSLSGFLAWLDIWHSGMISRGMSSYMRNIKTYPEHFLFYPIDTPAPNGILIIPFERGKAGECLPFLPDTLMGLSVQNVIIDQTTLPFEIRETLPTLSVLATPNLKITIRLGKKEDYPATMLRFLTV